MAKKKQKQARPAKSFGEALGINNFFQSDIFNGIFGVALFLFAVFLTIAFISYFSTGEADQSLVLDLRPGEWTNEKARVHECLRLHGSLALLFLHLTLFWSGSLRHSRVAGRCGTAYVGRL